MRNRDMVLQVIIKKRLKCFDIEISFSCPDEQLLVMIGPSGSGKTTILRMIAGLEKPEEGQIICHGKTWFDSSRRIDIPPQKRRIGYVFQDYTLFPHLSIYDNVAFAAPDRKEVDDLLDRFCIAHLRNRKPHLVYGGERQRCAICQALARRPQLLLLDEPFSSLDVLTRRKLRDELKVLKEELSFPVCYVTHDIHEALVLADGMIPIVNGRIEPDWMQHIVRGGQTALLTSRTVREPGLALAY